MGFFSTLGSVAKSASDAVQKHNEAVREKAEEYEYKDEDYLKNKFQRGTTVEKMAASKVLKARAYSSY